MMEPKKVQVALLEEDRIMAMQEYLHRFGRSKVWYLVPPLKDKTIIGTKWVFGNKHDELGTITKNKARLVVQGYNQRRKD